MFIQTEDTPNPETMKFIPGKVVMESGTASFTSKEQALSSPLAIELFEILGVRGVFYGNDFITITKELDKNWDSLKPHILMSIMEHYVKGAPLFTEVKAQKLSSDENDSDIVKQIKELIDTRVRPSVAQDGGDIRFDSFKEGIVYLEMHGSCSGCPSSTATLKQGIESMLMHYVPEVQGVEAI